MESTNTVPLRDDHQLSVTSSTSSVVGAERSILTHTIPVKWEGFEREQITRFKEAINANKLTFKGYEYDRNILPEAVKVDLSSLWENYPDPNQSTHPDAWLTVSQPVFFAFLDRISARSLGSKPELTYQSVVRRVRAGLTFDALDPRFTLGQIAQFLIEFRRDGVICTPAMCKNLDNALVQGLKFINSAPGIKGTVNNFKGTLPEQYPDDARPFQFLRKLVKECSDTMSRSEGALDWADTDKWRALVRPNTTLKVPVVAEGGKSPHQANNQSKPNNQKRQRNAMSSSSSVSAPPSDGSNSTNSLPCAGCGFLNHSFSDCHKIKDLSIDRSLLNLNPKISFADSARGKYLKAQGYKPTFMKDKVLPAKSFSKKAKNDKGNTCYLHNISSSSNLPCFPMHVSSQNQRKNHKVDCLLDTGADVNYISLNLISILDANKYLITCNDCSTCSGVKDICHSISGLININVNYTNELNQTLTITIKAHVVNNLNYDLIIGLSSIKYFNLILQFPSHFLNLQTTPRCWDFKVGRGCGNTTAAVPRSDTVDDKSVNETSEPGVNYYPLCRECSSQVTDVDTSNRKRHLGEINNDLAPGSSSINNTMPFSLNSLNRSIRSDYEKEDIHEIRDDQMEAIPSEMLGLSNEADNELPTEIHGPPSLQAKLHKLITDYKDIFSRKVRKEPAKLPPFKFSIDEKQWETFRNKTVPRRYDGTKSAALQKIVEQLLELGVIEPSDAAFYSHGFPVPKSTAGAWRLVIDLKNLNKISSTESWPIPNIKQILQRLGTHRASYFAVMDLTMGYHQAPMDPSCQKFTAFRTDTGLYQWNRLAMGLQGAGSYFQRVMSTIVLPRLIHSICELYLDDCIVPGADEDSFIERLEQVFSRFREFGITLHPDKCRFGLPEVEYVGHTINKTGTHFTRSKLDSILDFQEPSTQGDLKSFLGFANWFRDHVHNYHAMAGPLHSLLAKYNRRLRLRWTDATRQCYQNLKLAIHECPQLFFMDDDSPIFLHTDASDYGVGAYLFQVVDGTQRPIAFLSKSLNDRMRRWDTPQKEGYAIFYALDKFDYLLRDRKFTVRTDHANLTRLREDYTSNKKVQRWLTCFQHYDMEFDYIKGSLNVVADTLSRHCLNNFSLRGIKTNLNNQFLTIPPTYTKWISDAHNSTVGHHGLDNTLAKLNVERPNWPDRAKHVRMFIANCPTCQKMDQRRAKVIAHPTTASSYVPNQRIAIDYIERLIPDEAGNTAICVIIDCFTRYIELYPVQSVNAVTSAQCLLDWFTRYGAPSEITHDNGSSFINQTVGELIKLVGSTSKIATAYSKEENPIVERANKEVMRHLRNIIFDENVISTWSIHIPIVRRIMNSSVHSATGFTPASLLFGNSIDIDKGFLFPNKKENNPETSYSVWSEQRLSAHATLLDIARQTLTEKDEVHMKTYPNNRSEFDIDSYVLVEHRQNNLRRGPNSKLLPFLKGPMRVISKLDNIYTLQDIVSMRSYEYHIKNLRVFNFDPNTQNPLTYALKDDGTMYQVDFVSKHRGDPKKNKGQLKFLVHWVGYDEPTWEPWSHVRRNIRLHEYLRTHKTKGIRDLLPKNFDIDTHIFSDEEI